MTPEQCRAARAFKNWTQIKLTMEAGVSLTTLNNFERKRRPISQKTLDLLYNAFSKHGVVFMFGGVIPSVGRRLYPEEQAIISKYGVP